MKKIFKNTSNFSAVYLNIKKPKITVEVINMQNYFWELFEHTGSIEAYLAYKDTQASRLREKGDINEPKEGTWDSYRG